MSVEYSPRVSEISKRLTDFQKGKRDSTLFELSTKHRPQLFSGDVLLIIAIFSVPLI